VISHLTILVIVVLSLGAGPAAAGQTPPALRELKQAVARKLQDPEAQYNLPLIYYTQWDYQAASREFFALKGLDRDLAAEPFDYRFRITTSTYVTPPVKTMITFKGSPLLTQGTAPEY
jgi:hypothetical protein